MEFAYSCLPVHTLEGLMNEAYGITIPALPVNPRFIPAQRLDTQFAKRWGIPSTVTSLYVITERGERAWSFHHPSGELGSYYLAASADDLLNAPECTGVAATKFTKARRLAFDLGISKEDAAHRLMLGLSPDEKATIFAQDYRRTGLMSHNPTVHALVDIHQEPLAYQIAATFEMVPQRIR